MPYATVFTDDERFRGSLLRPNSEGILVHFSHAFGLAIVPASQSVNQTGPQTRWVEGCTAWIDRLTGSSFGHTLEWAPQVAKLISEIAGLAFEGCSTIDWGFVHNATQNETLTVDVEDLLRAAFQPAQLPPLFSAGHEVTCFERVLLPSVGASTFQDWHSRALFRSSVLNFCKIEAPEQVHVSGQIRITFMQRRLSRSIVNMLDLCQRAQTRPGVQAVVMDAAWLFNTCVSAWLMQETEVFVAASGSGNGMISLLPQGTVYIQIHAYRARNPLNKPLAYFGGVHYLEYVPLSADLIRPSVGVHPCHNASLLSCHFSLTCPWAFHQTHQEVPTAVFDAFVDEAVGRVGKDLDRQQDMCAAPLPWPLEKSHPGWSGQARYPLGTRDLNWIVCEPTSRPHCAADPGITLNIDSAHLNITYI